jgi:hypothetical protein
MRSDDRQALRATRDAYFLLDAWLPLSVLYERIINGADFLGDGVLTKEEAIARAVAEEEHHDWLTLCRLVWGLVDFNAHDTFADPSRAWGGLPDPVWDTFAAPETRRDWLVYNALAGAPRFHDALCHVAGQITLQYGPLPLWLQGYLVLAARDGVASPKRGRRVQHSWRDQAITRVTLVIALRYGLPPTRSPASKTESACSIVETALEVHKVHMTESNVERIWRDGGGPTLLAQEHALVEAFGPNLWVAGTPMGQHLDGPDWDYHRGKWGVSAAWNRPVIGVLSPDEVRDLVAQRRKEAEHASEAAHEYDVAFFSGEIPLPERPSDEELLRQLLHSEFPLPERPSDEPKGCWPVMLGICEPRRHAPGDSEERVAGEG